MALTLADFKQRWKLPAAVAAALLLTGLAAALGLHRLNGVVAGYANVVETTAVAARDADWINTQFVSRHKILKDAYLFAGDPARVELAASEVATLDDQVLRGLARLHDRPALDASDRQVIDDLAGPFARYQAASKTAIAAVRGAHDPYQAQQKSAELTYLQDRPISNALAELTARLNARLAEETAAARADFAWDLPIAGGALLTAMAIGWAVTMVVLASDMLERKRAEAAERVRQRALDASATGIVITDTSHLDGRAVYANAAYARLTGFPLDEVLNRSPRDLRRGTNPEVDLAIRLAKSAGQNYRGTLLSYRKDGTPFWDDLALAPVRDSTGHVTHWVGTHSDATERIAAERSVRAGQGQEVDT